MKQKGFYYIDEEKRILNIVIYRENQNEINKIFKYLYCEYNELIAINRKSYKTKKIYYCRITKNADIKNVLNLMKQIELINIDKWNENEILKE